MDINAALGLLCMGCMRNNATQGACPYCGFDEGKYAPAPHHLPLRTILGGKYLAGCALGEGGFGITYLAWDLNLGLKIAVKEFYPTGFVTRENTTANTVMPYVGDKEQFFRSGREKFVEEAKSLAKFYALPGIVSVRDFFLENGTAYIVMEFVEGETLKQRLEHTGGKLPVAQALEMMKPLMRSLSEIHKAGIIHRDISPDNIMVTPEGYVKLLDFGSARGFADSGNRSLSVLLKPGYAPEEQYRSRGVQGPWTDVYALCATIYRAITGVMPDEAVERIREDGVKPPSHLSVLMDPRQEAALMKGMAVLQKDRFQSIGALFDAMYPGAETAAPVMMPYIPTPETSVPVSWVQTDAGVARPAEQTGITGKKTAAQKFKALPVGRKIARVAAALVALVLVSFGALTVIELVLMNQDTPTPSAAPVFEPMAALQKTAYPTASPTPTPTPSPTPTATPEPTPSPTPTRTPAPKTSKVPVKSQTKSPSATQAPGWSGWVTSLPDGVTDSDYVIESKAQYRAIIYTWKEARSWDCTYGAWQDGVRDAYDPWDVCYTFVEGQNYTGTETRTVYRYKLK